MARPQLFWSIISLIFYLYHAFAQQPEIKITKFANLPSRMFYFEDKPVLFYHDAVALNLHISDDEGKTWRLAGIAQGEAMLVVEHPFDNSYAFVLTPGTKHYRTADRGKTWQTFTMPVQPALTSQPLSFHADPAKYGFILYQGSKCEGKTPWTSTCHDETYYTEDAFATTQLLLSQTSKCNYARSTKGFTPEVSSTLVFCVAFDKSAPEGGMHTLRESRMFSSEDYFKTEKIVDFGLGKQGRGVVALGVVSKFLVAALKDLSPAGESTTEMMLYVSVDGETWSKAHFPHASSSKLHENAYTVVESSTHSLAVDVLLHSSSAVGTLFVSNSNGTFFVQSLQNTNRNSQGYVDFENIVGVEGVGIANVVDNAEDVDGRGAPKKIKSVITYDDGSNWTPIRGPDVDMHGKNIGCDTSDLNACSLHLYSVTQPHNYGRVFSSTAPGFVMGVGNVGPHLLPYEECDTFLSLDAGLTWRQVYRNAHKYEFGDQGSVIVMVPDEESTNHIMYSWDDGKTWVHHKIGISLRARLLTTVPDSTSQKFILLGTLDRDDQDRTGRHAVVYVDFAVLNKRKCEEADMEKWYARTAKGKECLMGHKQWYWRRKADADCYVGNKFQDPVEHEDNCPCTEDDYECDYNFVRSANGECVPVGPEPIPAGICSGNREGEKYMGSSGYRLVPGNTCTKAGGVVLDTPVQKDCSKAQPPEGEVTHQTFEFPSPVVGHWYFKNSHTILVQLDDGHLWQSSNEGYTWAEPRPNESFLAVYMHTHSNDRAYLITDQAKLYITTDAGQLWIEINTPLPPNLLGINIIAFHPLQSDWLIWTGGDGCNGSKHCNAVAYYTTNHGRKWEKVEDYVRTCSWARDTDLKIDERQIICESYRHKTGSQNMFGFENPLELWIGSDFYKKKQKLFSSIVGYAKFSEYLLVAELPEQSNSMDLQVSLDGKRFATGLFPPNMRLDNHAYTILESSTDSVFLHVTMSGIRGAEWGNLLKSNSNGTYYGLSLEHANRNERGFVDFEKMIGLDGIAVMNVVSNVDEAPVTGKKRLQTRITHNDGGTWKPMAPPAVDSLGQSYSCTDAKCALHIHGYTERIDSRATYSSPSAIGLMMAVGNVGENLAPYTESDTFLTRDGGFTWEEVHKDAHMYEFGDSGSVLVIANDERPTDHVLYSTDEGLTWKEYKFGDAVRVRSIVTVPMDTSRKFILFGYSAKSTRKALAIHLDFSAITSRKCVLSMDESENDDFELWSPSEEREEPCLFGRQVVYHRRLRNRNCYIGDQEKQAKKIVKNCACAASDMECDFNYVRNSAGDCVLAEGATPLPRDEETCKAGDEYWYERTAYRKIPYSTCEAGLRPDLGESHVCPGLKSHSLLFWLTFLVLPFGFTALIGYWYYRRGGFHKGSIRLPDNSSRSPYVSDSGPLSTLASVPWFVLGLVGASWAYVSSWRVWDSVRPRTGYRNVPVDEDAQVLRFEDEE